MDLFDFAVLGLVFVLSVTYFFYKPSQPQVKSSSRAPTRSATPAVSSSGFIGRMKQKNAKLIIFYGSQTGTAEDYARRLMKEASQFGITAVLADLMDYQMDDFYEIPSTYLVIFVLATYGDGEPTDNANDFNEWLQGDHPDNSLKNLHYAMFGLGNKTYTHFNAMARKTDTRLQKFGAKRLHNRGEGDDDGDLEEDFVKWTDGMWKSTCEFFKIDPSTVQSDIFRSFAFRLLPKNSKNVYTGELGVFNSWSGKQNRVTYDQINPYYAPITAWKDLYSNNLYENGDKDLPRKCFHMELDISGTSLRYQSGDHVAVYAPNDPQEVQLLANVLGCGDRLDEVFEMRSNEVGGPASKKTPFPCPTTLRAALTFYLDIQILPKMHLLALLARFATDEKEKEHLKKLSSVQTKDYYHQYIYNDCRNLRQVLEDHRSVRFELVETDDSSQSKSKLTIADLFETLPRLQPRYYSISSSSRVSPSIVHITASVVRYKTEVGRIGNGIATSYLYNLLSSDQYLKQRVPIFLRKSHFKLPRNNLLPVILIGPGTGLAPLRGFILERKFILAQKLNEWRIKQGMEVLVDSQSPWQKSLVESITEPGLLVVRRQGIEPDVDKMIGKTLLFFGCRDRKQDFLYADELVGMSQDQLEIETKPQSLHDGLTGIYCAFSREKKEKTYVQQLLLDYGEDVWKALDSGAYVYVCGDAKNMAKDVLAAMLSLAKDSRYGRMVPGEAEEWLRKLKESSRYQEDVWS